MKIINEILNQKIKEIQDEVEKRDGGDLTEIESFNAFLRLQKINDIIIKKIKNKKCSVDVNIYLEKNKENSTGYSFTFGNNDKKSILSIISNEMWSKCNFDGDEFLKNSQGECFHICPICKKKLYIADYYFESCHGEYSLNDNYKKEKCEHFEYMKYNDKIYFISIENLILKSKSLNREIEKQKILNIIVENHELAFNTSVFNDTI